MPSYTLKDIRRRVNDITRDSDTGLILEAIKNRTISDRVRSFIEETQCNINEIIFSLADGTTDGTLEYDKNGNTPTITYTDVEGWPYYVISGCDRIQKIFRWKGTADDSDGEWRELSPVDDNQIDVEGLLDGHTAQFPHRYQTMGYDRFRVLPELSTGAYTIKFKVKYVESVVDLIPDYDMSTDDADPIHSTVVGTVNDMNIESESTTYGKWEFEILTAATPDTFRWRKDEGDWSISVNCATTAITIGNGLTVSWTANTGHADGDIWTIYQNEYRLPFVPLKYREYLIDGCVASVFKIRVDERAMSYEQEYRYNVERIKKEVNKDTSGRKPKLNRRYVGAGG